jgi:hypothetical protein
MQSPIVDSERARERERARRSVKGVCDVRRFYNTTKQTIVEAIRQIPTHTTGREDDQQRATTD